MLKRLSVVMLATIAIACSGDRLSVRATTEGTVFDRGSIPGGTVPLAEVSYTVANTGEKVVFLQACGSSPVAVVERLDAGSWEEWTGGAYCLAIYPMAPIEAHSGNRVLGAIAIADAGRFRLRFAYADNSSMEDVRFAFTEPFDVR